MRIGGAFPRVKAYRGALPRSQTGAVARGIEFTTPVMPTKGKGSPLEAHWCIGTPGVKLIKANPDDFAAIEADVTNYQQGP